MAIKKILGLDLGISSIGWAYVLEDAENKENSKILDMGVRADLLSSDEKSNFFKIKGETKNALRSSQRSARSTRRRYQERRKNLLQLLKSLGWYTSKSCLVENGKHTTLELLSLRAKAAVEKVTLTDLSRVLLSINKKRGYKSNRKMQNSVGILCKATI